MGKLFGFLLVVVLLSGCQTADDALTTSSTPVAVTGPAASAIAGDMASRLAEQIGPAGVATIKMENDTSEFATALEAALKGWGYTVVTDGKVAKDVKPVELAYAIERFDGGTPAVERAASPSTCRRAIASACGSGLDSTGDASAGTLGPD